VQAAVTSAVSFSIGALVPILCVVLAGRSLRIVTCVVITLVALAVLGAVGAELGNASRQRGALRVLVGGSIAMAVTIVVGRVVGSNV
jgi:vacuolar iron transporter family protein